MSHRNRKRTVWVCMSLVVSSLSITGMGCARELPMSIRQEKSGSANGQLAASAPASFANTGVSQPQTRSRANDVAPAKPVEPPTIVSDGANQMSKPKDPLSSMKGRSVNSSTQPYGMKQKLPEQSTQRPPRGFDSLFDTYKRLAESAPPMTTQRPPRGFGPDDDISKINERLDRLEKECERLRGVDKALVPVIADLEKRIRDLEGKGQ
jgi:hypothetical protein